MTILQDKQIILAVTGSIACYKAVDLASKLTQQGAQIDVILTESAQRFVTPLTFQSVTGRPVYTDMWGTDTSGGLPTHIAHVGLGETADILLVAPATANTIAKLAHGTADNLLTVTALASRCPLVIAPAMDGGMYEHPATQDNIDILLSRGAYLIEPDEGRFASGLTGKGRLPDTPTLIGHIRQVLGKQTGALVDKKIIVTAGGTREPLDPVRFITNRSSGKQGYAIAQVAIDMGADVTLISSAQGMTTPIGAQLIQVESAQEMHDAVISELPDTYALIMSAAVSDFRPATRAEQKIKKSTESDEGMSLNLARNPDILLAVKAYKAEHGFPHVTVGFAAESENLQANAQSKLERKGLDLLVANDITATDAGFATDTNRVLIVDKQGNVESHDLLYKEEVAHLLLQRLIRDSS